MLPLLLVAALAASVPCPTPYDAPEWIAAPVAREHAGCRVAIVARTAANVRDVCIEGESGLLAVHPPGEAPSPQHASGTLWSMM